MRSLLKNHAQRFLVALSVAIGMTVVFNSPVVHAVGEPTVSWTTSSGLTFAGTATLNATASVTSGYIKQWCITKNGVALTTNLAVSNGTYSDLGYNGRFSASTGCWSSYYEGSNYSLLSGRLSFDTTAWVDGSHTYQITVTDSSGRTATSTVLTINNANTGPSVAWTTSSGLTFAGTATLNATAAPSATGSAYIKQWCITKNGVALTTNLAVSNGTYSDLGYNGRFSASTGCWSSYYEGSNYSLLSGRLSFDTTAWVDGSHTYQITVTDSSGRTATSTVLTMKTVNPPPTLALVGLTQGAKVSGTLSLSLNVSLPSGVSGLSVSSYCFKLNGSACSGSSRGVSFDTTSLVNGTHTVEVSIVDWAGRTITLPPISFTTANAGASVSSINRSFVQPYWTNKTVTASLSIRSARATDITVRYGTSAKSLTKSRRFDTSGGNISGLKPNTKYYFSVQASGPNGSSSVSLFSVKSPKIPAKPRIISSQCIANGFVGSKSGDIHYRYNYLYLWSNGDKTYSTTKVTDRYPC